MNRYSVASLVLAFLISVTYCPQIRAGLPEFQDELRQAEVLIQQGRQHGLQYLSSKDKRSKKAAERALKVAENQVKAVLKRSANCEKCHELITNANFLQAYFGFSKDYDDTIDSAKDGLQKFPNNGRLVYLLGYAEFNTGKFADANKSLKAALLNADQNTANEINAVLQKSQQAFLTGWNRHANFYQSNESRILRYNPSTYRYEVAFQVTPEFEYQLGAQGLMALMSNARPLNDPEIQQYVENLVTRIVSKSPGSNFSYRVTIVDSDEVNAMTPPGYIVVSTGLLRFTENEAQLAGVLSHELAHNYGHHQARAFIKNYQAQLLASAILGAINSQNAAVQILSSLGANVGLMLFSRAYSRFEEKEADHYGAHLMFNAGYSPLDASSFFLKMSQSGKKEPPKFLSTHPPSLDRENYLMDYLESFPTEGREFRSDSEEFRKISARLKQARPGRALPIP